MIGKKLKKITEQLLSMFCMLKKICVYTAFVSNTNSNDKKKVIVLTIPNWEGCKGNISGRWYCLAIKRLSVLLRGIKSKHHSESYCLIAFIIWQQKTNLNFVKKVRKNKDFCNIIMPFW